MFYFSLLALVLCSLLICVVVQFTFRNSISQTLSVISTELSAGWSRYMKFAIYVVGISGGVNFYPLRQYAEQLKKGDVETPVSLTSELFSLYLVETSIDTLQSLSTLLFAFFTVAMICYFLKKISLRRVESKKPVTTE